MHIGHKVNAVLLQSAGRRIHISSVDVQVEMFALLHKFDRRVPLVSELWMKQLTTDTDAYIEILLLKTQREPQLGSVETN